MATVAPSSASPPTGHLLRLLGVAFGLAVGIGSMVGGGILRTPGAVAAAAPDMVVIMALWLFGAVHILLGANIAVELFTAIPKAGGSFVPVRRAFGGFPAMVIGWTDALTNAAWIASLGIAGAEFLALAWPGVGDHKLSFAIVLIGGLAGINALGVREGRAAQMITTILKVGLLVGIIVAAVALPGAPASATSGPGIAIGIAAILSAYQLVYGAYTGWQNPTYFVEEDVAPGRNLPRAIFWSILAVALLYFGINAALFHSMSVGELAGQQIPVGELLERLLGRSGSIALGLTGFVIILGCCNAGILCGPRILFGLARAGLFPRYATQVSASGTPLVALAIFLLLSIAMTATGSFEAAFRLMGTLTVVMFVAVDLSFFALRRSEPALDRPFRAVGYPLLPALALMLDIGFTVLILWYDPRSGLTTLALIAATAPIWLLTKRFRHAAKPA